MKEFNETEAVAAMRAALNPESAARISDDELEGVIDIIWDWYDENGLLEIDAEADDDDVNVEELVAYVRKVLAKDKECPITPADVEPIVAAELLYEQSLDDDLD